MPITTKAIAKYKTYFGSRSLCSCLPSVIVKVSTPVKALTCSTHQLRNAVANVYVVAGFSPRSSSAALSQYCLPERGLKPATTHLSRNCFEWRCVWNIPPALLVLMCFVVTFMPLFPPQSLDRLKEQGRACVARA